MIVTSRLILNLASLINAWEVEAITIWPFLFVSNPSDRTLQHERIHLAQVNELYVIGFYLLYGYYWAKGWWEDPDSTYALNPFEIEAYKYENEPGYLFYREPYAWR